MLYGANFEGMKLAGMILIAVGFFLVMFPDNWPDYITRLLRSVKTLFSYIHYTTLFTTLNRNRKLWYLKVIIEAVSLNIRAV